MSFGECAVLFNCGEHRLVGVLCTPQAPKSLGVVIVVGGPQYRCGSHRQFVLLARRLAAEGFAVLRFDCRGMGDSEGDPRSFEDIGTDIGAAVDMLARQVPGVTQVALWGLCDGASAALLYLDERHDARIKALCLANPWVRTPAGLARTHLKHYYLRRLGQRDFWAKLALGRIGFKAVADLSRNLHTGLSGSPGGQNALPFQDRMSRACEGFAGPVLIALSEDDYTAREFETFAQTSSSWQRVLARDAVQTARVPGANHTFSATDARIQVETATLKALAAVAP
jgi:exosortase A-associated hydrolase 1